MKFIRFFKFLTFVVALAMFQGRASMAVQSNAICPQILKVLASPDLRKEMMQRFVPTFVADGFTGREALAKLDEILLEAAGKFESVTSQAELENKISDKRGEDIFDYSQAVSLLPGFVALAPFSFDFDSWMKASLASGDDWGRTKSAIRFMDLWINDVRDPSKIIRQLMVSEQSAPDYYAMYYTKLKEKFAGHTDLMREIENKFKGAALLKLISLNPVNEIPADVLSKATQLMDHDEKFWQSDSIKPARHASCYAGNCSYMFGYHDATFVDEDSKDHGKLVLIYVQGELVGSMKMIKHSSILGLRNVRDSKGRYPMVVGGVYATSNEIVQKAYEASRLHKNWARLDLPELQIMPVDFVHSLEYSKISSPAYLKEIIRIRNRLESKEQKLKWESKM